MRFAVFYLLLANALRILYLMFAAKPISIAPKRSVPLILSGETPVVLQPQPPGDFFG